MRSEALPEGWRIFQAVLPFLRGKEGGSALHLNTTAEEKQQLDFYFAANARRNSLQKSWLLRKAVLRVLSCYSVACAQLNVLLWNCFPKRGHPGTSLDRSLANSQQPGSWDGQGPVAGPVPGQRKEASYWNTKGATAAQRCSCLCFLGTFSTSHSLPTWSSSLFACLRQWVENSKGMFSLARLKLSLSELLENFSLPHLLGERSIPVYLNESHRSEHEAVPPPLEASLGLHLLPPQPRFLRLGGCLPAREGGVPSTPRQHHSTSAPWHPFAFSPSSFVVCRSCTSFRTDAVFSFCLPSSAGIP